MTCQEFKADSMIQLYLGKQFKHLNLSEKFTQTIFNLTVRERKIYWFTLIIQTVLQFDFTRVHTKGKTQRAHSFKQI
jgi:hypothetical protein